MSTYRSASLSVEVTGKDQEVKKLYNTYQYTQYIHTDDYEIGISSIILRYISIYQSKTSVSTVLLLQDLQMTRDNSSCNSFVFV